MISMSIVHNGLAANPKHLHHSFVYEGDAGKYFDAACTHENYYLYTGDLYLQNEVSKLMAERFPEGALLVEYGCGHCDKSLPYIEKMKLKTFVGADIDPLVLANVEPRLRSKFPDLNIITYESDVFKPMTIPGEGKPRIGLCIGSLIGVFEDKEAILMMKNCLEALGDDGILIVSFDANQDPATNLAPYRTPPYGVFVKNALHPLNHRYGGNFDVEKFDHVVDWDPEKEYVEHCLKSKVHQTATVAGKEYVFEKDEKLIVFGAYKRSLEKVTQMVQAAGGAIKSTLYDQDSFMCLLEIKKS